MCRCGGELVFDRQVIDGQHDTSLLNGSVFPKPQVEPQSGAGNHKRGSVPRTDSQSFLCIGVGIEIIGQVSASSCQRVLLLVFAHLGNGPKLNVAVQGRRRQVCSIGKKTKFPDHTPAALVFCYAIPAGGPQTDGAGDGGRRQHSAVRAEHDFGDRTLMCFEA